MMKKIAGFCAVFALSLAGMNTSVEGQLYSQGKKLSESDVLPDKPTYEGPSVDFAGEMRRLVQKIAKYGRTHKKDFVVLLHDGKGLLTQVIDIDQQIATPSSAFIKTIDGIVQPNLSYGLEGFGKETAEKEKELMLRDLQVARDSGLSVFTLDYADKPADIDKAIRFSRKNDFVPYVAPGMGFRNNKLPNWPRRPVDENAHTITNAKLVKNYAYIQDSSRFGTAEEFAMKMHNTNYDMIITNVFHHRSQNLGRHNVRTMQFKKLGSRRPVLAYLNIGYADSGAYYWRDDWRQGNPSWIMDLAPYSADLHTVQYWHPGWHDVLYGNNMSFLYGIMKDGFDGVLLDGVNVFEAYANP